MNGIGVAAVFKRTAGRTELAGGLPLRHKVVLFGVFVVVMVATSSPEAVVVVVGLL